MSDRLSIDDATLFDDVDARTVEFPGDIGSDRFDFALQYDALEALDGAAPDDGAIAALERHRDAVEAAATAALARDADQDRVPGLVRAPGSQGSQDRLGDLLALADRAQILARLGDRRAGRSGRRLARSGRRQQGQRAGAQTANRPDDLRVPATCP